MRKICMAAMALLLMAVACNKPWDPFPGQGDPGSGGGSHAQQFALKFAVSNILQNVIDPTGGAQAPYNYLYYYLEGQDGKIHQLKQTRGDTAFGRLTDSVPSGMYRITVIASNDSLPVASDAKSTEYFVHLPGGDLHGTTWLQWVDATIDKTLWLPRLVGKVSVTITDALPSNASKLVLLQHRTALAGSKAYPQGLSQVLSIVYGDAPTYAVIDIPDSAVGKANFSRDIYLLANYQDLADMAVNVQDGAAHVIGAKEADAVKVKRNRITAIRTALFDGAPKDSNITVYYPVDTIFQASGKDPLQP